MPSFPSLDSTLVDTLHARADAARWGVSPARLGQALAASVAHSIGERADPREVERYLSALHVKDLALACACADGHEAAWEHFVLEHRPVLYRAADAISPGGAARELADALYADLYGVRERDGERQSLLRYYHGRSSLATWLRAVLSQRHVDAIREHRRTDPLPEEGEMACADPAAARDPDRPRYLGLIRKALAIGLMQIGDRDRLRLALYYVQQLTLAEAGRILGEHEATVSRHLARTRKQLRKEIDAQLQAEGLSDEEVGRCFASAITDAGPLDLGALLGGSGPSASSGAR